MKILWRKVARIKCNLLLDVSSVMLVIISFKSLLTTLTVVILLLRQTLFW